MTTAATGNSAAPTSHVDTDGRRQTGLALAIAAALVSGVAVFVNGEAVRRFPSATVYTTGKNLIAALVLIALVLSLRSIPGQHQGGAVSSPLRRVDVVRLGAVACIGGGLPFVLFFEGLARANSSDAAFIHKTLVVWTAVLAARFLGERLSSLHVGAIGLLIAGHLVIAEGVGSLRVGVGESMILLATLFWAAELIIVKQLVATVPPSTVGASRLGGGTILLLAWLAASGRLSDFTSLSLSQWTWLTLTGAILATFVTVWFAAIERVQVIDAAAVLVLGAVVTGLLDLVVAHEPAGIRTIGWILIVGGVSAVLASHIMRWRRAPAGVPA